MLRIFQALCLSALIGASVAFRFQNFGPGFSKELALAAFNKIDADGNGFVSLAELEAADVVNTVSFASSNWAWMPTPTLAQMFTKQDSNKDGQLTIDELYPAEKYECPRWCGSFEFNCPFGACSVADRRYLVISQYINYN